MTPESPAGSQPESHGALRRGDIGGGFDAADCGICALDGRPRRLSDLVAAESDRWIVRHHAPPAPLAGWFLLCARRHVQGPARFSTDEAVDFGPALQDVSAAIERISGALRVYAIAFGEGSQHLHVHLVPRTADRPETAAWKIADWYREVERGSRAAAPLDAIQASVESLRMALLASSSGRWYAPQALALGVRETASP